MLFFLAGTVLLFSLHLLALQDESPDRFKKWLEEEVVYIITPLEKEVFSQLQTDRERDLFVQAFWRQRDPTLGTDENEFRTEHYKRINYVNHFFGRGQPKPGWRTDRGRVYIILGEPNDIVRYEGKTTVYPTEVWFYQGMTDKGLPPGFYLVFFQQGGIGEYQLYSPLTDGPMALLTQYYGDQTDYIGAFNQLREFEPDLAPVSLSLIPGEGSAFALGRPSLSSDILVNRVETTAVREVETKYARKFLEYKDIVEVEYSTNYIDSDSLVKITKEASGMYFVNYAIEPERLSINQFEDKYYTTLKLNGTVSDLDGKTIHQFEKTIPLEFDSDQIKQISHMPFSIRDMFPLIPGNYKVSILVKNEISKEFTSMERTLFIPGEEEKLQMTSLLLGYQERANQPAASRLRPFQFGNSQVYFQAARVFLIQDELVLAFQIHGLGPAMRDRAEIRYSFTKEGIEFHSDTRRVRDFYQIPNFIEKVPLSTFPPAHYRVKVSLIMDGQEVLSENEEFDITHLQNIARPWIYSKLLAGIQDPVYDYIVGTQFFNSGKLDEARTRIEHAYRSDPENMVYALNLARLYMTLKKFDRVTPVLKPFLSRAETPQFEVYFILGKAYQYLGELAPAIEVFNQALQHHGLSTNLLNVIGDCYFQLGNIPEAKAAWEKSLEINPDQPEVQKSMDILKEKE